jgi:Putative MetA-pathway of phenol degradation
LNRGQRIIIAFSFSFLGAVTVHAVSPLVIDDADTTAPGRIQVNPDFTFFRTDSVWLYSTPINPVVGLSPRAELGVIFGYQWRDGSGSKRETDDADGVTDLTFSPKVWLWQGFNEKFKISARVDLKLPTASEARGLGTGDPDIGVVGIATYKLGKTSLDWNVGYSVIDISGSSLSDDHWFVGQAVRQEFNKDFSILAETYAVLPHTRSGGNIIFYFSAGPQWNIGEHIVVSALIGSAAGHNSPDLTGTFELAFAF